MEYMIGDVIEFHDFSWSDGAWVDKKQLLVGRIDSIIKNVMTDELDEWELWLEYYSEVQGRMYVTPDRVVRIIERGKIPFPKVPGAEFKTGTRVTFVEEGRHLLDEICGFEFVLRHDGLTSRYQMKHTKFVMEPEEFEVIQ
jgi:hypothetical protein